VNPDQIDEWSLPTRPAKGTDSRSGSFEGNSFEVDAIDPTMLRRLVHKRIVQHIDSDTLLRLWELQSAERETLRAIPEDPTFWRRVHDIDHRRRDD
jgi:hypothetical protein